MMKNIALGRSAFFVILGLCFGAPGLTIVHAADSSPAPTSAMLETVEWTLTELKGKPVQTTTGEGPRKPLTLQLSAEKNRASGFSGVNRFFGSYERDGEKLKFGPLAGTRMAGPPEAMALESEFLAVLGNVTHFRILSDGKLELLQDEQTLARFKTGQNVQK